MAHPLQNFDDMVVAGLFAAHLCACAALIGGRLLLRRAALALALGGVFLAWLAPAEAIALRAVVALGALWVLARVIDVAASGCDEPYWWRLWFLTAPFDVRQTTPRSRAVLPEHVIAMLGYGVAAAVGALVVFEVAPRLDGAAHYALRWGGAAIAFYAAVELGVTAISAGHATLGVAVPPIQRAPIRSRSIAELWARRWNRPVSQWLRRHCFVPLVRRGWPLAGLALAFVASGYLHFHFIWAAVGAPLAALAGLFFVVQIPLILVERALRVARWPAAAARAWTITVVVAASPLFLEPMLQMIVAAA